MRLNISVGWDSVNGWRPLPDSELVLRIGVWLAQPVLTHDDIEDMSERIRRIKERFPQPFHRIMSEEESESRTLAKPDWFAIEEPQ